METARVDIRKLQLLNDRISQCLDALAQVRLSVHGLSHTQATPQQQGIGAQGFGPQQGFLPQQGFGPQQAFGQQQPFLQQQPFGQQQQQPFNPQQTFYGGLAHTPFGQQLGPQQTGYWPQPPGQSPLGQSPLGQSPFSAIGGLSHTGNEIEALYARPLWADPMLAARVKDTFPYVAYTLPPVVSLF